MYFLLSESLGGDFGTTVLPILRYILVGIILVCAIVLIVTTILQSDSNAAASSVISGVQESFFSQNKGESRDGILKKITIAMISIIAICVILYFVSLHFTGKI